ncbi:MAG TPA: nitroreductase family protein [Caulobacteraceae bacterium]|nr:nitroreductase family protein [Caulobacteraceae bacterium]
MNEILDLESLEDIECETETKHDRTLRRRTHIHDIQPGADWNEVEHAILTRRSIRKFKGRQVPEFMIRRILEMGRFAPSQGNCQPWSFVVVRDKELIAQMEAYCVAACKGMTAAVDYTNYPKGSPERAKILESTQALNRANPNAFHPVPMTAIKSIANGRFAVFHKAPTVILILMDKRGVGTPEIDIGVVGQNMVLAAQSLGLGTCWIGFSRLLASSGEFMEKFGVAPPFELAEAISVGYPIGNPTQHPVARQTHQILWLEDGQRRLLDQEGSPP